MSEQLPQKDAMDVLQAFVNDYNARARPAIPLGSAGEAGGAQLRLRYSPAEGQVSIFHMVAINRNDRPAILVQRFDGPRSEEHTSELQSQSNLVCRLLLEKKK